MKKPSKETPLNAPALPAALPPADYTRTYVDMTLMTVRRRLRDYSEELANEAEEFCRCIGRDQVPTSTQYLQQIVGNISVLYGQLEILVETDKLQKAAGK